ncbi:hypothetical protein AAGX64_13905 [Staphylococcus aureus]
MIRSSPDIQEAKRNKCIQRNNTCKWSSIIWRGVSPLILRINM